MPISNVTQWSSTPASNTDIGGISLDGLVMQASQVDNAIRELMAQVAGGISASYFIPAVMTLPKIWDTSATHKYSFGVSELAADRTITLPLLAGNDTFVFEAHAQTLTNKTLTSPTINTPTISTPTISGGTWTGGTDLAVADGGTGRSSATANAVICGGTTATGPHQSVATGSAGQVLVSNGAGSPPSFQTLSIPTPDYAAGNAALPQDGVGTYSLVSVVTGSIARGAVAAGSGLRFVNQSGTAPSGAPTGTWRNMAADISTSGGGASGLFMRIA